MYLSVHLSVKSWSEHIFPIKFENAIFLKQFSSNRVSCCLQLKKKISSAEDGWKLQQDLLYDSPTQMGIA